MRWREGQCNQFQVMPHNLGEPTYSDALQWSHVQHNVMDAGIYLFDCQVTSCGAHSVARVVDVN
jgi:hypothetical protein